MNFFSTTLALLFLSTFTMISCHKSIEPTSLATNHLTGQVGMYSYRNHALTGYKQHDNKGFLKKTITIKRNSQGRITEKNHYDAAGFLFQKLIYEYDDEKLHRKIKQSHNGETIRDNLYTYDRAGLLKEQQVFDQDGKLMKTHVYIFNPGGERIQKTTLDAEGSVKRTKTYKFDSKKRRYQDDTFSPDGSIVSTTRYIYDDSKISRIQYSDGQGNLKAHAIITYDKLNQRLKKERFDIKNKLLSTLYYLYE